MYVCVQRTTASGSSMYCAGYPFELTNQRTNNNNLTGGRRTQRGVNERAMIQYTPKTNDRDADGQMRGGTSGRDEGSKQRIRGTHKNRA